MKYAAQLLLCISVNQAPVSSTDLILAALKYLVKLN